MSRSNTAIYHHRTQGRGVEAVHIHGICGGLRQLGYNVVIIGPPGVKSDPNVVVAAEAGQTGTIWGKIARFAPQLAFELMELGYNAVALPRLFLACRRLRPSVMLERYALYNASGLLAARIAGIPIILEVNDTVNVDRTRQGKRLAMPFVARLVERAVLRRADGIVVVSGYLRDQVAAAGVLPERICVTPNAVDASVFDPERVSGERIRERYGLRGKTVVGFAGSFTKWHRVDLLVEACATLVGEHPELALLLVGDGALCAETREQASRLGLGESVVFTGKVPHSEMPEHVAAMDIGVMPESNVFGSPMKVFEYMAMRRPPIAPRYTPLEEAVDDGRTGLLFEPRNVSALTACLRQLLGDRDHREAMGCAGRQRVLGAHLWSHNAERTVALVGERALLVNEDNCGGELESRESPYRCASE